MILQIKDQFLQLIRKDFSPDIEIEKRIRIISDLEMFRAGEDKSVWQQSKGQRAKVYQVYFDDEYICNFNDDDILQAVYLLFWRGMKAKYEKGMIRLDPLWKKQEEERVAEEEKKIKESVEKEETRKERKKKAKSKIALDIVQKLEDI